MFDVSRFILAGRLESMQTDHKTAEMRDYIIQMLAELAILADDTDQPDLAKKLKDLVDEDPQPQRDSLRFEQTG